MPKPTPTTRPMPRPIKRKGAHKSAFMIELFAKQHTQHLSDEQIAARLRVAYPNATADWMSRIPAIRRGYNKGILPGQDGVVPSKQVHTYVNGEVQDRKPRTKGPVPPGPRKGSKRPKGKSSAEVRQKRTKAASKPPKSMKLPGQQPKALAEAQKRKKSATQTQTPAPLKTPSSLGPKNTVRGAPAPQPKTETHKTIFKVAKKSAAPAPAADVSDSTIEGVDPVDGF